MKILPMSLQCIFLIACSNFFLNSAFAQDQNEQTKINDLHSKKKNSSSEASHEPVRFKTITVEAVPVAADPIQKLQNRELRIRTSETLGKTLEREMGVNNLSYGPSVGQPVIRGMSGPRVRIMQNEIGMHDLSTLVQILPLLLKRCWPTVLPY